MVQVSSAPEFCSYLLPFFICGGAVDDFVPVLIDGGLAYFPDDESSGVVRHPGCMRVL